jgi:hypothetical protein
MEGYTGVKFEDGKFVGYVNGKEIVRGSTKYYVKQKVTQMSAGFQHAPSAKKVESEFGINERFGFVERTVSMIAKGTMPSCVITGEGGLGKSYSVIKALEENDMKNVTDLTEFDLGEKLNLRKCYRVVKGFSTAKGLYRTLFECNNMTVVFDDCDSVLKDPIAVNILKGALDSYSKRYISWNAEMRDDELPRSFEFKGRIIFISNMSMDRIDQAIRSRSMCLDLSMNQAQKIERMEVIAESNEFLPEVDKSIVREALDFLKEMIDSTENLSLRTLIAVSKIANERGDWKPLAKYVLSQGA